MEKSIQIEREIADQIINQIGIVTIRETETVLIYDNGVYKDNNTAMSRIRELITDISESKMVLIGDTIKPYNLTISKKNQIIEFVKTSTFRSIDDFDSQPNRINVKNGHLIRTKGKTVFLKHFEYNENPYLSRIQIPINYDPDAENLEIDQIFEDIFGFETLPLIYEMMGYLLLPHTKYSKAFMLYGDTGTGKTTAINIISRFVGHNNISGIELQVLDDKFELEKTRNKLINIFDDLSNKPIEYVGNFKKLVTNTFLFGRIKFLQNEIRWKNRCKGLFACNILPTIKQYISDAFYSRWVLIPCFSDLIKNPTLREKKFSEKEMSGLLNKVLEALDRLELRGGFPDQWQDLDYVKNRWNLDVNPVALFVEECCEKGESNEVDYNQFFEQVNIFRQERKANEISKTIMTKSLKKLGIERKDKGSKGEKRERFVFSGIQFTYDFIMDHLELQTENPVTINNFINGD